MNIEVEAETEDEKHFHMSEEKHEGKRILLSFDLHNSLTANGLSNDITVVDTSTNKVIATVKVGDGPWGIAI